MDPLSATWSSSQLELLDDPTLIHHLRQMKSSIIFDHQPNDYINSFSINHEISSSEAHQSTGGAIFRPPSALTFCTISTETLISDHQGPPAASSDPPISTRFISFGEPNSTRPITQKFTAAESTKAAETNYHQMICFDSNNNIAGFSSTNSPIISSNIISQELFHEFGTVEYGQPIKKGAGGGTTRTPLQAKYHVLAERKRRQKLLQQFIALSAIVPGLKKLNKTSIMDGAIDHLKRLENRLKVLEEEGEKKLKNEGSVLLLAEQKPCMGYYYEEECSSPQSFENFSTLDDIDQSSQRNIQIRILKRDVLIRVTCEDRFRFTEEEFVSEINKLNLSVTKSRFIRFGGNMLAVSAVAKMEEGFCMTEEELVDSTRLAILRLI